MKPFDWAFVGRDDAPTGQHLVVGFVLGFVGRYVAVSVAESGGR